MRSPSGDVLEMWEIEALAYAMMAAAAKIHMTNEIAVGMRLNLRELPYPGDGAPGREVARTEAYLGAADMDDEIRRVLRDYMCSDGSSDPRIFALAYSLAHRAIRGGVFNWQETF